MNYQEILDKLKQKRDYFQGISFFQIASDYTQFISLIENILQELEMKDNIINQHSLLPSVDKNLENKLEQEETKDNK